MYDVPSIAAFFVENLLNSLLIMLTEFFSPLVTLTVAPVINWHDEAFHVPHSLNFLFLTQSAFTFSFFFQNFFHKVVCAVLDPELPLLHFISHLCLQTLTLCRTVPYPPIFRLTYMGIVHSSFFFTFFLYVLSHYSIFASFGFEKVS
jgi:hypothetical protein